MRQRLLMMADYHLWANTKLYNQLLPVVTDGKLSQVLPCMFFQTIRGTLVHMVLAEDIWWTRMHKLPACENKFGDRSYLWGLTGADLLQVQELFNEKDALANFVNEAEKWRGFVESFADDGALEQRFEYKDTKGNKYTLAYADALLHVFNHATHHRGQVSAALTSLGVKSGDIDLLYSPYINREQVTASPN